MNFYGSKKGEKKRSEEMDLMGMPIKGKWIFLIKKPPRENSRKILYEL